MDSLANLIPYLYPVVIGLVAGYVASLFLGGKGGLVRKLIVGLLGGVIGGILMTKLGLTLTENIHLNNIINATAGACLLLFVVQFLGK